MKLAAALKEISRLRQVMAGLSESALRASLGRGDMDARRVAVTLRDALEDSEIALPDRRKRRIYAWIILDSDGEPFTESSDDSTMVIDREHERATITVNEESRDCGLTLLLRRCEVLYVAPTKSPA